MSTNLSYFLFLSFRFALEMLEQFFRHLAFFTLGLFVTLLEFTGLVFGL
jgi:hypothetical protein